MEVNRSNINFQGRLYGYIGNHKTKPIVLCEYGDEKFIKHINKLAKKSINTFDVKFIDGLKKSMQITTSETPKLSFAERLISFLNTPFNKALRMKKKGIIDKFTYDMNLFEYQMIKRNSYDNGNLYKEVMEFEANLRKKVKNPKESEKLERIIY